MSYRFRITNLSHEVKAPGRNIFLTDMGKLLRPGEQGLSHKVGPGTLSLQAAKVLRIEEGSFNAALPFTPPKPAPVVNEDDEKATPRPPVKVTELFPDEPKKVVSKSVPFTGEKIPLASPAASAPTEVKAVEPPLAPETDPELAKMAKAGAPTKADEGPPVPKLPQSNKPKSR